MSMASRAIFSNFFEEQWTSKPPTVPFGIVSALFPTTFFKIAVHVLQQSASLCGWRHKRSICLSHGHAIFICSNANYVFTTGHAHNWKNWTGFNFLWFIILCKMVVLDTADCTSLGLYDLEVIQWGSIYSNTVYNSLHFKHRYFFLSILILSWALTPLVQTTSLLSFSTHYSILIFSGIFFIFSEIRSDPSQRLKWRPQSSNSREWRSQSWNLHH